MDISRTTVFLDLPTFNFYEWRAFQVRAQPDEAPTLHLAGWTMHGTRVCSPITDVDVLLRFCLTRSEKLYNLLAPPADSDSVDEEVVSLWETWKSRNHITWQRDVTRELESAFQSAQKQWGIDAETVPDTFPTDYFLGAVPGVQPKLLARERDGKLIVGPTTEELQGRYDLCLRLATQYLRLDEAGSPTVEDFVCEFLGAWDLTPAEQQWMVARLNTTR
jgi:hypothetical protein